MQKKAIVLFKISSIDFKIISKVNLQEAK